MLEKLNKNLSEVYIYIWIFLDQSEANWVWFITPSSTQYFMIFTPLHAYDTILSGCYIPCDYLTHIFLGLLQTSTVIKLLIHFT